MCFNNIGVNCIIVDSVIIYTFSPGSVGNADRMNQRYECRMAFPGVSTPQNREETPKQNPTGPGNRDGYCSKIDTYGVVCNRTELLGERVCRCYEKVNPTLFPLKYSA